jgi:hypothetical protein
MEETWVDRLFPLKPLHGLIIVNYDFRTDVLGNVIVVPALRIICTWFGG